MKPQLTFAIGDIHGEFAKAMNLFEHCLHYSRNMEHEPGVKFIFLGDYIDRGRKSKEMIEWLMKTSRTAGDNMVCLKGNHEDMCVSSYQTEFRLYDWLTNGGNATLDSYGISDVHDMPQDHIDWMEKLPLFVDDGKRFFVHGGVDPGKPLDKQDPHLMMWARPKHSYENVGRFIVHGHTPTKDRKPLIEKNRINIDTGAVFGGPLTAAVFDDKWISPIAFINDTGEITKS